MHSATGASLDEALTLPEAREQRAGKSAPRHQSNEALGPVNAVAMDEVRASQRARRLH